MNANLEEDCLHFPPSFPSTYRKLFPKGIIKTQSRALYDYDTRFDHRHYNEDNLTYNVHLLFVLCGLIRINGSFVERHNNGRSGCHWLKQ